MSGIDKPIYIIMQTGTVKTSLCSSAVCSWCLLFVRLAISELTAATEMMMVWCFVPLSTLFKSYQDDGRVIMKGSEQQSHRNR